MNPNTKPDPKTRAAFDAAFNNFVTGGGPGTRAIVDAIDERDRAAIRKRAIEGEPSLVVIDDPMHPDRPPISDADAERFAHALRSRLGEEGGVAFVETAWRQETGDPMADIRAALAELERKAAAPEPEPGEWVFTRSELEWLAKLCEGTPTGNDLAAIIAGLDDAPGLRIRSGVASSLPGVLVAHDDVVAGAVPFLEGAPVNRVARTGQSRRRAKSPKQQRREGARLNVTDRVYNEALVKGRFTPVASENRAMRRRAGR